MSERQRIQVRLKDPSGRFYDPETKFRIKLKETKQLEYPLGALTRQSLNAGGLVIANIETPPQKPSDVVSTEEAQPGLLSVPEIEAAIKPPDYDDYSYMQVYELRTLAKSKGIKLSRKDTAQTIRAKLRRS